MQVDDLQAEVASQMQEAEVEMDCLTRAHMERLHELAAHPWFTITPSGTASCLSKPDHARLAKTGLLKDVEEEEEEEALEEAAEGDNAGQRDACTQREPSVAWQDGLPLEVAHMQLQQMQEADREGEAKGEAWEAKADVSRAAALAGLGEAGSKGSSMSGTGIRRLSAAMKQAGLHANGGMPGFGEGGSQLDMATGGLDDLAGDTAWPFPLPKRNNQHSSWEPAGEEGAPVVGGPSTEEFAVGGGPAADGGIGYDPMGAPPEFAMGGGPAADGGIDYNPMKAGPAFEAQFEGDGHVLGAPAFKAVHEVEEPMPDGSGVGRESFAFGPGEGMVDDHGGSGYEVSALLLTML
ncbi:hypothetical protein DUNSADRAFT_17592 [Dunaliella salina]|uniref:Uncharacterized protein n=1 Tax=Dunaliella salina TaxID=3046 RepID=A0ABQ7G1I1_DUNSA|nr:hypothetical protein DUNSADRAFT_17592 [Dunaliella salina]|eukprot:KAF5828463.1 hypothetical protein DUNSADRAFT_17592 [Dunaliella salina]